MPTSTPCYCWVFINCYICVLLIMLRWQGLSEAQDASRQPGARVVPIGRVRQDLPPDTPEFGPANRAQQIRGRRREAQQRFPG